MNSNRSAVGSRGTLACLVAIALCVSPAFGQRYMEEALPYRNGATIRTAGGFVAVTFMRKEYTGPGQPQRTYYTYYRDSIYATQGGYHGYPLHGRYIERYAHRGLRVLGRYRYGLRVGKWQYWDEGGVLRKVSHWNEGQETGRFAVYDTAGRLQQRGYFRDGKFNGMVSTYQQRDSTTSRDRMRYRCGKLVEPGEVSWLLRAQGWVENLFW